MKTSTKATAAERPQSGRRRGASGGAASRQRGERRPQPPPQAAVHAFFREGCVNVKYSGATRARSLCFITYLSTVGILLGRYRWTYNLAFAS